MAWYSRFKIRDWASHNQSEKNNKKNQTFSSSDVTVTPVDTIIEKDDGTRFKKNSKGAWDKVSTAAEVSAHADALTDARRISLSGDASGYADFDGSQDVTIPVTIANLTTSYNDLTDKPTIPSISGLATTSYVDNEISLNAFDGTHSGNTAFRGGMIVGPLGSSITAPDSTSHVMIAPYKLGPNSYSTDWNGQEYSALKLAPWSSGDSVSLQFGDWNNQDDSMYIGKTGFMGSTELHLGTKSTKIITIDHNNTAKYMGNEIATMADLSSGVTTSDTPPSSPSDNALWFNSSEGQLYVYYNDGDSSQWVATSGIGILHSQLSNLQGHIIPDTDDTYDLGSPTKRFRDLYLGPGSLYVNNKKVISDESDTMEFKTDANQNLRIKTTGTGDLEIATESGNIELKGTVEILTGKKIIDSTGNSVQFGNDIEMNSNTVTGLKEPVIDNQAATKKYVDTRINNLIGGADSAYDTLVEIQNAMATDAEVAALIANLGSALQVSDTSPSGASIGDLWFNSSDGQLYVYYDDGTSTQWVSTLGGFLDLAEYYTKSEVDTQISSIDLSNYYTKAETNTQISSIDLSNYYTKAETNTQVANATPTVFTDFNAAVSFTLPGGNNSYTWSPSLPANKWVALSVHISSTDSDQNDHFDIKVGPGTDFGSTWGDTYPSSNVSFGWGILTHPGDSQGLAGGYYGMWDEIIAKTNGSGQLVFSIVGSNGGSGVTVRTKGYWS